MYTSFTIWLIRLHLQGSSINWMMMKFMGDDKFAAGLAQYIEDFQYGNAAMVDLFNSLNKVFQM